LVSGNENEDHVLSSTPLEGIKTSAADLAGSLIDGRYRIQSLLGEGASGRAYLATHAQTGQQVCLKLLSHALLDEHGLKRFRNETRALSALDHPGIVKIYAAGVSEDGTPYLAQELLTGQTVDQACKQQAMPTDKAIDISIQLLEAIEFMHSHKIIHRDIKPSNLFVTTDGTVKILDFGVARLIAEDQKQKLTQTGAIIGSPAYMSPEQMSGVAADERADIYAAGCVLFELLTGKTAFAAENLIELLAQKQSGPPKLDGVGGPFSQGLSAVLSRSLSGAPDSRYQKATEMREDLTQVASGMAPTHAFSLPVARHNKPAYKVNRRLKALLPAAIILAVVAVAAAIFSNQLALLTASQHGGQGKDEQAIMRELQLAFDLERQAARDEDLRNDLDCQAKCKQALDIYDGIEKSFKKDRRDFNSFLAARYDKPDLEYESIRNYPYNNPGTAPTGLSGRRSRLWFLMARTSQHIAEVANGHQQFQTSTAKSAEAKGFYENTMVASAAEGEDHISQNQREQLTIACCKLAAHPPTPDPGQVRADKWTSEAIRRCRQERDYAGVGEMIGLSQSIAIGNGKYDKAAEMMVEREQAYFKAQWDIDDIISREKDVARSLEAHGAHRQAQVIMKRAEELQRSGKPQA
jgi:hypothetical protein